MRFRALDGWRGIAALVVALNHLNFEGNFYYWEAIRRGGLCVDLFFVLSGFVICHTYGDRLRGGVGAAKFAIRRFGRLYPLHIATLGLLVGLEAAKAIAMSVLGLTAGQAPFSGATSLPALAGNVVLIQAMGPFHDFTWNIPSWSISTEFWVYFLFAPIVLLAARWRMALFAMCAALGLWLFYAFLQLPDPGLAYEFPRCVYGFFVGCLVQTIAPRGLECGKRLATLAECVMIGVILILFWTRIPFSGYVASLVFGLLIFVFAGERGGVSGILSSQPLVRLGDWSYAIYMIHYPIITVFTAGVRVLEQLTGETYLKSVMIGEREKELFVVGGPLVQDGLAVLFAIVLIALSRVVYERFEVPCRNYFNRIADALGRRAAAPVPQGGGAP
jgi:hypothetical protein